jgi:hypothetical protein
MGRQLNIRSDEAYELAHGAALRTGKAVSQVVLEALRDYGRKTSAPGELTPAQKANVDAIREAARRAAAQARPGVTYEQVMEDMYDENGLPR